MQLTGGVSQNYQQNLDGKGRIYYTDEFGNRVNLGNLNPLQKFGNKLKAFGSNVVDFLEETDPNSQAYKDKVGLIAGTVTAPFGLGAKGTATLANGLKPLLGKKLAQMTAEGIGSGAVGGGTYGAIESGVEGENPLLGGLKGLVGGGLAGGGLGYGLGKIGKTFAEKAVLNNPLLDKTYYADYVEGLSNPSAEMMKLRGLRSGVDNGTSEVLADSMPNHKGVFKYLSKPYLKHGRDRYYVGDKTSPKINKILDYVSAGHSLDETIDAMLSKQFDAEKITEIFNKYQNGIYKKIPGTENVMTTREVLNPEWTPTYTGNNLDEILEDYANKIDTDHIGHGYYGYSMSNNAKTAYEQGSLPMSKWHKQDFLDRFNQIAEDYNLNFDMEKLSKTSLKDLKQMLKKVGYHHTSKFYNATDFYNIDLENATKNFLLKNNEKNGQLVKKLLE